MGNGLLHLQRDNQKLASLSASAHRQFLCSTKELSGVYVAAEKGHADCILKLVSAGGDVNKCDHDGRSPIYIAASSGHSACVSQLLASRADARSTYSGTSALDVARQNNHTESVRVLEAALA